MLESEYYHVQTLYVLSEYFTIDILTNGGSIKTSGIKNNQVTDGKCDFLS